MLSVIKLRHTPRLPFIYVRKRGSVNVTRILWHMSSVICEHLERHQKGYWEYTYKDQTLIHSITHSLVFICFKLNMANLTKVYCTSLVHDLNINRITSECQSMDFWTAYARVDHMLFISGMLWIESSWTICSVLAGFDKNQLRQQIRNHKTS